MANTLLAMEAIVGTLPAGRRMGFTDAFWYLIDQIFPLAQCDEIFSFCPDDDSDDPLSAGALWSFNYFLVSKAKKKLLFLCSKSISGTQVHIRTQQYLEQNSTSIDPSPSPSAKDKDYYASYD